VRPLGKEVLFPTCVEGVAYLWKLPFLAVVTDFGVASGRILGAEEPEVSRSLEKLRKPHFFPLQAPTAHILQYRDIPSFARDPYTVLKWLCYPSNELPGQPWTVRLWSLDALHRLERNLQDFAKARAQLDLFHHLFHPKNLETYRVQGGGSSDALAATLDKTAPNFEISQEKGQGLFQEAARLISDMDGIHPGYASEVNRPS
jgi:hypothetical protein